MTMMTAPDMFRAVIDRITRFYLEANAIFYEAARGSYAVVLTGERRFFGNVLIKKGALPPET